MPTIRSLTPDLLCSQHMRKFLDMSELPTYVDYAIQALKNRRFDSLAFRGMSGAVIAPPVALALHKNLIMVRKSILDTHSDFLVEGNIASKKYIIIDDFVSSGKTFKAIMKAIDDWAPKAKCLGILGVQNIDTDVLKKKKYYPLGQL
jgi:adenine/guanine phosphoribosyltransferase-like PRPP-binding protein